MRIWIPLCYLLLLLPASCGFEPVYGSKRHAVPADISRVQIAPIPGRLGQLYTIALEDTLNPEAIAMANYTLTTNIESRKIPIAIEPDGSIARYNIYLTAPFTLTRNADKKQLLEGSVRRITSFNVGPNSDFSTFVSEEDALARGVRELAKDIQMRLSNLFANRTENP